MAWEAKKNFSTMDETTVEKFQETAVKKRDCPGGDEKKIRTKEAEIFNIFFLGC